MVMRMNEDTRNMLQVLVVAVVLISVIVGIFHVTLGQSPGAVTLTEEQAEDATPFNNPLEPVIVLVGAWIAWEVVSMFTSFPVNTETGEPIRKPASLYELWVTRRIEDGGEYE